ncbi:hypothetical protein V2J09_009325 [Rumex salicifolius]
MKVLRTSVESDPVSLRRRSPSKREPVRPECPLSCSPKEAAQQDEVDHKSHDVYSQLELHKLLDVYVHSTSPFGYVYYSREVVIQNDYISIFFGNL